VEREEQVESWSSTGLNGGGVVERLAAAETTYPVEHTVCVIVIRSERD
jgi:hypothetical protein